MAMDAEPTMTTPMDSNNNAGINTQLSGQICMGTEPARKAWLLELAFLLIRAFFISPALTPDYLIFSVARPASTRITEMIQKRTMTRGSGQPFNSKWW